MVNVCTNPLAELDVEEDVTDKEEDVSEEEDEEDEDEDIEELELGLSEDVDWDEDDEDDVLVEDVMDVVGVVALTRLLIA